MTKEFDKEKLKNEEGRRKFQGKFQGKFQEKATNLETKKLKVWNIVQMTEWIGRNLWGSRRKLVWIGRRGGF